MLVERLTRFVILPHLDGDHSAETVTAATIRERGDLPGHLRRSMTSDRGTELAEYGQIQTALDTTLLLCDPHLPWQRGSNENMNRLGGVPWVPAAVSVGRPEAVTRP